MEKIAIVRRNGLGDLLCAVPLYRYLQTLYPEAKFTFFVDERNAPLFRYFPDKITPVVFPKNGNKYFSHLQLALKHRGMCFDLAVSAKTSPMKLMNFFLFFLGARKRVAVAGKKWHKILINQPITERSNIHQALKALQMIAPNFQAIPEEFFPTLSVPNEIKEKYCHSVHLKGPFLLLSASTTKKASRLEEETYTRLVNELEGRRPFSVLIVGKEHDRNRAEKIAEKLKVPHQVCIPENFDEFMTLLDMASLFFVGDGGMAHISAALRKKGVIFFGESSPCEWGPLSNSCSTLYHPRDVNEIDDEDFRVALRSKFDEVF
jgi:ADP-heptose:LPS heptosyltransferase